MKFDLIVVGLGAMGSAALYQAAKRGARVLGIDRFAPPHTMGSSHGDTRITRQAVGEGEIYMPFVRRSNAIWRELEAETGVQLFHASGGLIIAPESAGADFHVSGDFVALTQYIARKFGVAHELLDADEIKARFPLLLSSPGDRAYHEPGAGVLRPERCIQTQLDLAREHGASIRLDEKVTGYEFLSDGARVDTEAGSCHADKLILSAGAWMRDLLPAAERRGIRVCRQVIHWFAADDIAAFAPERFPFVIWIAERAEDFWSVFPAPSDGVPGVKLVTEQYHTSGHPDAVQREVTAAESVDMYHRLTLPRLKGLREERVKAEVCLYTVTQDEHFIIDFHPASGRGVVASPCSGHGFKHSAAIGEALVQMALDGGGDLDVSPFALARLRS